MSSRKPESDRIIVLKGTSPSDFTTIQLPNPSTGQVQCYVCSSESLQELQRYKQRCSSWFVGNHIVSDGGLHVASPVDPLFVLLPLLEKSRRQTSGSEGMFCSLEDMLEGSPLAHLAAALVQQLPLVCDVKAAGGDQYYRLNDDKVLAWLRCKARQALAALAATSGSSIAALDPQQQLGYALGFLSEYLSPAWHARLVEHCGVQPIGVPGGAAPAVVLKPVSNEQPAEKKPKVEPQVAARKKAEQSRAETKAAQMAKQAEGTKKLTAFFMKGKK